MFYSVLFNAISILILIVLNIIVYIIFYKIDKQKTFENLKNLIIVSHCFPITTKIIGMSSVTYLIENNFLRCVISTCVLYNTNINSIFLSNNFYNLQKNLKIYSLYNSSYIGLLPKQLKIVLFNNLKTWFLVALFFLTDDSIFFIEGCSEHSFLQNFI